MIALPLEFTRKGFLYKLLNRWDCPTSKKGIAILEQYSEGDLIAYEVIRIQKQFNDEPGPGGVIYKAKERVPGDESWGIDGWTYSLFGDRKSALDRAKNKFEELKQKIQSND